jgi:hypothetical protein
MMEEVKKSLDRRNQIDTWIDKTDSSYPREVAQDHINSDNDHSPIGNPECDICGLAVTGDGKRHGFDIVENIV